MTIQELDKLDLDLNKTLTLGSQCDEVFALQNILNTQKNTLKIDGFFGEQTEKALFEIINKNETSIKALGVYFLKKIILDTETNPYFNETKENLKQKI